MLLLLLLALSCTRTVLVSAEEVSLADCQLAFTYGYTYNRFFTISTEQGWDMNDGLRFPFLVRARSDAHILLSLDTYPADRDPVYEIVIGAGKNTFCDIRRLRRSATKATKRISDLLSQVELRGFWIHLDGHGLIEFGREGEDVPILKWLDPQPLNIKYFSFSTWTGVVGKWVYGCPSSDPKEKMQVVEPKPATMIEKLRKDLLSKHDPYIMPGPYMNVQVQLSLQHIKLDEKQSIFTVRGKMLMNWVDETLQWNPEDYNGVLSLPLAHHEAWTPEIVLHKLYWSYSLWNTCSVATNTIERQYRTFAAFFNAAGTGTGILTRDAGMILKWSGEVTWSPLTTLKAWCYMELHRWPYDEHTCELHLGAWSQLIQLELNQSGVETHEKTLSEWEVIDVESEYTSRESALIPEEEQQMLSIYITLKRRSQMYSLLLLGPYIVGTVLVFLSFWLSPFGWGRLLLLCLTLVMFTMLLMASANVLPAPADHVPRIIQLYSMGMVAVVFVMLSAVASIYLSRSIHTVLPPTRLCTCLDNNIVQQILLLNVVGKEQDQAAGLSSQKTEKDCKPGYNHLQESSENIGDVTKVTAHYWSLLAVAVDRIACLIYVCFIIFILSLHF